MAKSQQHQNTAAHSSISGQRLTDEKGVGGTEHLSDLPDLSATNGLPVNRELSVAPGGVQSTIGLPSFVPPSSLKRAGQRPETSKLFS